MKEKTILNERIVMRLNSIGPNSNVPSVPTTQQVRQHKQRTLSSILLKALFIFAGAAIVSVALELFLVPNMITDGGITGVSVMTSYLSHWPLGIFLFLFNLPFLIVGYKQIGKTFALSTLFGITIMSIGTALLHPVEAFVHDTLLAFVFGGILLGLGTGIVIRAGGSLDGTEIVAILLSRKLPFSVGEIIMFFNFFILLSAGFVFTWERALFSLLAYYIAYKTIDIVVDGLNESKSVWIISDQIDEIGDAILNRLGRGVTYLSGEGGFSGDPKRVIFCVITRLEEAKLKEIVNHYDESAFLAVGNIHDVKGGRFKKKAIH
ncbi:YitT family protein [Paenibacillus puldeungensis]|uniref:YitT family protein n=1 Tax=Paenibacillus puldeungensis TaxID=696536 RepID=A0ABW3S586_9BACL